MSTGVDERGASCYDVGMNRTWFPPILRGKILTSPGWLLAAAAVMLLFDLPRFGEQGMAIFGQHAQQLAVLVAVLLLAPRRWVALLLMLPATWLLLPAGTEPGLTLPFAADVALTLFPLWAGVIVACRRRRRVGSPRGTV